MPDQAKHRSSSIARQQQRTALMQALAAATVANGVTRVDRDWDALAEGLEAAMAGTPAAEWLASAGTLSAHDLERFMAVSSSRPQHLAAWEVQGSSLTPYIVLELWTPVEVLGMLRSPVSLAEWRMLASRWLAEAARVRRDRRRVA